MSRPTSKDHQLAAAKNALYQIIKLGGEAARIAQGTLASIVGIKARAKARRQVGGAVR